MKAIDFIKKRYKEEFNSESAKRFIEIVDYSKLAGIMEEYANKKLFNFYNHLKNEVGTYRIKDIKTNRAIKIFLNKK